MPPSKRIHRESGATFQIKSVVDCIKGKEKRGQDASYERELLKAWSKVEGYEGAKKALEGLKWKVI